MEKEMEQTFTKEAQFAFYYISLNLFLSSTSVPFNNYVMWIGIEHGVSLSDSQVTKYDMFN